MKNPLSKSFFIFFSFIIFLFCGCDNSAKEWEKTLRHGDRFIRVSLIHQNDSLNCLRSYDHKTNKLISEWELNYPIYQLQFADLDNDNSDDIMVGVIKSTRYDSLKRKRLFIFKLFEGYIRPMWLGTSVGQPLEDFRALNNGHQNITRTIESETNGNFLIAEYKYQGFGLQFLRYIEKNITLVTAEKNFSKN